MFRFNLEVYCYVSNKIIIYILVFLYFCFVILDSFLVVIKMFFNNKYCRQYIVYLKLKMFFFLIEYIKFKEKMFFNNKYCRWYFVYLKLKCFFFLIKYIKFEDENSRNKKKQSVLN